MADNDESASQGWGQDLFLEVGGFGGGENDLALGDYFGFGNGLPVDWPEGYAFDFAVTPPQASLPMLESWLPGPPLDLGSIAPDLTMTFDQMVASTNNLFPPHLNLSTNVIPMANSEQYSPVCPTPTTDSMSDASTHESPREFLEHQPAPSISDASTPQPAGRPQKRFRKSPGAFPCQDADCDRRFDRAGDARKHFQRTHIPVASRKFGCPKCDMRFNWEKDVVRHDLRMHAPSSSTAARADPVDLTAPPDAGVAVDLKQPSRDLARLPVDSLPSLLRPLLAVVAARKLILRVRARRRERCNSTAATATAGTAGNCSRFILVTRDARDFRAIDISAVQDSRSLDGTLRRELNLPQADDEAVFIAHTLGQGVSGPRMDVAALWEAVKPEPGVERPARHFLMLENTSSAHLATQAGKRKRADDV